MIAVPICLNKELVIPTHTDIVKITCNNYVCRDAGFLGREWELDWR